MYLSRLRKALAEVSSDEKFPNGFKFFENKFCRGYSWLQEPEPNSDKGNKAAYKPPPYLFEWKKLIVNLQDLTMQNTQNGLERRVSPKEAEAIMFTYAYPEWKSVDQSSLYSSIDRFKQKIQKMGLVPNEFIRSGKDSSFSGIVLMPCRVVDLSQNSSVSPSFSGGCLDQRGEEKSADNTFIPAENAL